MYYGEFDGIFQDLLQSTSTNKSFVRLHLDYGDIILDEAFDNSFHQLIKSIQHDDHCVTSFQIRSFFWSVFSCIWTEYSKIRTRRTSVFRYFSCSGCFSINGGNLEKRQRRYSTRNYAMSLDNLGVHNSSAFT